MKIGREENWREREMEIRKRRCAGSVVFFLNNTLLHHTCIGFYTKLEYFKIFLLQDYDL